jgi:hypothetical protein
VPVSTLEDVRADTRPEGCPGGASLPKFGSVQQESTGSQTGECLGCSGRFGLDRWGLVPGHTIPVPLHAQVVLAA